MATQRQAPSYIQMKKTSVLSARLPDPIKEAVEKAAADDSRSVASFVTKALTEWLMAKGYLK